MKTLKPLDDQQIKFCVEYINNNRNIDQAALAADYSKSHGHKLIAKPEIQAYIQRTSATVEKEGIVTFQWKAKKLKQIIEICVPDWATKLRDIDARAAVAAIVELNMMQGDRAPVRNHNLNVNIKGTLEQIRESKRQYKEY